MHIKNIWSELFYSETWFWTLSVTGFLSTLPVFLIFACKPSKLTYPSRCFVFIAMCSNLICVAYTIRAYYGQTGVVCENLNSDRGYFLHDGSSKNPCVVIFTLTYLFGMAAAIWWVIMSISLFFIKTSTCKKETIEKMSFVFHVVSWMVPAINTIIILVKHDVDADGLTGLCFTGMKNTTQFWSVLLPLFTYLVVGFTFLFAGYCWKNLNKYRNANRFTDEGETECTCPMCLQFRPITVEDERELLRICTFSILYGLILAVVVSYHLAEHVEMKKAKCLRKSYFLSIFLWLKHCIVLVSGTVPAAFVFSYRALPFWKYFECKVCKELSNTNNHPVPEATELNSFFQRSHNIEPPCIVQDTEC